jgi:hypothetical protein
MYFWGIELYRFIGETFIFFFCCLKVLNFILMLHRLQMWTLNFKCKQAQQSYKPRSTSMPKHTHAHRISVCTVIEVRLAVTTATIETQILYGAKSIFFLNFHNSKVSECISNCANTRSQILEIFLVRHNISWFS